MTALDWIIAAFVVVLAFWGYAQGLIVSGLSLLGFGLGAFLGSRMVPVLLADGSSSPYAPLFTLFGALFIGTVAAVVLEEVGSGLRDAIPFGLGRLADGVAGALLLAAVALGLVWIAGAVALQTPGARQLRRDIQRSAILSRLNDVLPPSGPVLNSLARFDPLPQVTGPRADVPPPTGGILADPDVQRARGSVVRVLGDACGLAISGSGWVAAPGTVVTNAHVVAGEQDTFVETFGGQRHAAQAYAYDPNDDVAVLHVPTLGAPTLSLAGSVSTGESVAILGYPENGPYTAAAGRLGTTATVISVDAYGQGPIRRRMTALRGQVRPGNSGGPVVDGQGNVATTIFAGTTRGEPGGYGVPRAGVRRALRIAQGPVGTGPCAR